MSSNGYLTTATLLILENSLTADLSFRSIMSFSFAGWCSIRRISCSTGERQLQPGTLHWTRVTSRRLTALSKPILVRRLVHHFSSSQTTGHGRLIKQFRGSLSGELRTTARLWKDLISCKRQRLLEGRFCDRWLVCMDTLQGWDTNVIQHCFASVLEAWA